MYEGCMLREHADDDERYYIYTYRLDIYIYTYVGFVCTSSSQQCHLHNFMLRRQSSIFE